LFHRFIAMFSVYCFRYADAPILIAEGLSEAQAKAYCQDPRTSSTTCDVPALMDRFGGPDGMPWFFGFEEVA
jgi:hypothetical protein